MEFSITCAVSFYIVYQNVGKSGEVVRERRRKMSTTSEILGTVNRNRFSIDCHKSGIGLFIGILVLVIVVAAAVINLLLLDKKNVAAITLFTAVELFLLIVSLSTALYALVKMSHLERVKTSKNNQKNSHDMILLAVTLAGVLVYDAFYMIDATTSLDWRDTLWNITRFFRSLADIIQSLVQVWLVLVGSTRHAISRENLKEKPGRGAIMARLIINLVMWGHNSFLGRKSSTFSGFYQVYDLNKFMPIINICFPLIIFYRFHSSACLAEIWKHSYLPSKKNN